MLDTFQSLNSRDFKQRYNGSFGYYKDKEKDAKVFVLMSNVGEYEANFIDEKENVYTVKADQGVEFEFIPVKKKLFLYKGDLLYIRRRPARMWARGINMQNTHISRVVGGGDLAINFPRMIQVLSKPVDPLQSVKQLEEGKVSSIVLTDLFGVTEGKLFLYDVHVGDFKTDTHDIVVQEPHFKQEIVDMVVKLKLPYTVSMV